MQFSTIQQRGRVPFPVFTGERIYMREFTKSVGLPCDLQRWQDTVDAMLDGVDVDGPIFLMVDQSPVSATTTHRRPGIHVDGYWSAIHAHDEQGHGFGKGENQGGEAGRADCHRGHLHTGDRAEALILAADLLGCAAYIGEFGGLPGPGGDCAHIDVSGLIRVDMEPGHAWAGHALTMLHEALPLLNDCLRTVVRLNVPGWVP